MDVAPIALLNRNSEEVNAHDCEAARSVHDFYLKKKENGPKQQQQQDNSDKGEATARAFGDAFCVGGDDFPMKFHILKAPTKDHTFQLRSSVLCQDDPGDNRAGDLQLQVRLRGSGQLQVRVVLGH